MHPALARFVTTIMQGMSVQAAGGATRKELGRATNGSFDGKALALKNAAGLGTLTTLASGGRLGAANGALESLARALALELAPVRVNCVSPGIVDTPMMAVGRICWSTSSMPRWGRTTLSGSGSRCR